MIWDPIVQPDGMLDCKWPKRDITDLIIAPVQRNMEHECVSHVHDGHALHDHFGAGHLRREHLLLTLGPRVLSEILDCKNAVVATVLLDIHTSQLPKPLLKTTFGADCLKSTQQYLALDPNESGRGVIEYRTTMVAVQLGLLAKPSW